MLNELDALENKANTDIKWLISKLSEKEHVVDSFVLNISAIKMYASDLQSFIGSRLIEVEVGEEERYIQSLHKDGSLNQIRLKLNIDSKLLDIESTIESFGSITSETDSPLVVLKGGKDKEAQIMSVLPRAVSKSFDELTLSEISVFAVNDRQPWIHSYAINGVSILPGGKIILADSNSRKLFIVNNDGMLEKSISCLTAGSGPYDVTFIKNNEVAIFSYSGIQIINIHFGNVLENIKTDRVCQGIAYINGTLICSVKSKGIQCIQIANKAITTLVTNHEIIDRLGISVHGTKIYETNFDYSFVNCYTLEGKYVWQFQDTSVLREPTGIAVDNNSNVYFQSSYPSSVFVLSSDGKKVKKILSSKDGLYEPRALHFDETNKILLVATKDQPTYLYHVS